MARPKKGLLNAGAAGAIKSLVDSVRQSVEKNHTMLPQGQAAGVMSVALESYDALGVQADDIENTLEAVKDSLNDAVEQISAITEATDAVDGEGEGFVDGGDDLRQHQKEVAVEAAAILAMSHNSPRAYYRDGYAVPSFESDVRVNEFVSAGANGSIATLPAKSLPSLESFDEKETEKWREHSYAINMIVAKQHEFAELFYRTYIVTPDQAGFQLSIRRNLVWEGWTGEGLSGEKQEISKRNILQGLLDYTTLETNSTELIPVIQSGENDEQFIDPSVLPAQTVKQGKDTFDTNFLKFSENGEGFNLLMLAQTPSRLKKGSMTFTDSLDSRIALKQLLISVTKGGTTELFALDVNRDQYAAYTATREYNFRLMQLKFHTSLGLGEESTTVAGAESALLKDLFDLGYRIELDVKVDGEMNVENGNGDTSLRALRLARVFDKEGKEIALTDSRVSAALSGLTVTGVGYSLEARLTNINQLEMGLLIDSDVQKQGFMIPTLPPLVIVKPAMVEDDKTYPRLEALTTAYRIQMRNNAVTTLLNRADTLKSYLGVGVPHPIESNLGLEGVGQYYVRPYYNEATIDVLNDLNNLTSAAKQTDIQGLIVSKINEMVYTADQLTGYTAALEAAFSGRSPKPHVAIGTDMRLPQYIQINGDDRTVGIGYDYTIARISDLRMKDKIVMTFILPNESEPHPLQHGVLGFIPEYLVDFNMIRNQRIGREIRLTPRYRYFNFLPIMLVINVINLEEAIAQRTALDVNETQVTPAS
ncbi:major head protein [Klebsiella phage vB_KpM_Centimanus]|uniref:hypothetical protein n=1 Tax=Klebsiella pneumoniae TaxID=573 RepID=UPI000D19BB6C|nr:hypothetical protein [Klebsiella pneumoniae]